MNEAVQGITDRAEAMTECVVFTLEEIPRTTLLGTRSPESIDVRIFQHERGIRHGIALGPLCWNLWWAGRRTDRGRRGVPSCETCAAA